MSKLKVAFSKCAQNFLSLPREESGLKYLVRIEEARKSAGEFYGTTLPKIPTIPNRKNLEPRINVWLWVIGYLRLKWPEVVEKNLKKSEKLFVEAVAIEARKPTDNGLIKNFHRFSEKLKNSHTLKFNSEEKYFPDKFKKMLKP